MLRRSRKAFVGPPLLRFIYNKIYLKTGFIPDDAVRDITSRLSATTTWGVLGVVALGTVGVDTSPLLTGLGVGGAALGFAAKDIGANFMAGVLLALNRNRRFGHGDRLRVGVGGTSVEGSVTGWDMRHLTLLNDNGEEVLIPNSMVFSSVITVGIAKEPERRKHRGTGPSPVDSSALEKPKTPPPSPPSSPS